MNKIITREEALKEIKKVIYSDVLTDKSDKYRDIEVTFLAYLEQQPTLYSDIEEAFKVNKELWNFPLDINAKQLKRLDAALNNIKRHIQALEIRNKELEGKSIKDKIKNFEAFYTNENGVGIVRIQASELYELQSKLDKIEEVINNWKTISGDYFDYKQLNSIKSILDKRK